MSQRKKINKTIEDTSKRKLSIQFSLDGFSFCIANSKGEQYEFASYSFEEKINSPENLLKEIEAIFKKDSSLQDDFESILVVHKNNLNSLVPNSFFKESELKNYLKFSSKTISTDFIAYDDLNDFHIKNVYIPYVNINNFLFQHFGEFEYQHHSTILLDKLKQRATNDKASFYVNVNESSFDIVVLENQKLTFYNSFDYTTKEDFIYYILFTMEQLKNDPNEDIVTFLGVINKDSELFKTAYTYIRNIDFLNVQSSILKENIEFDTHSNFILLG